MRTHVLLLTIPFSFALHAQVIIDADDMPDAGDTLRYRTTTATGLDLELTGADVTWDFGDLNPQGEGADTTVAVGATPFLYQLFFNNIFLFPEHRADYGVRGAAFNFQILTLSDVYDYFRADGEGFFNVGFGANVNGLPTSVRRMPTDRVHAFPLEFGDTDVSPSSFNVTVPTLFYFGQDQVRSNEVDGWGTLILPADTFEVLRVKSTLQRTDTIFIEQFGFGFRLPEPETVEYKWIAPGMAKPVLEVVTTAGIPISAEFYYDPEEVVTSKLDMAGNTLAVFPNPARHEVFVQVPNGRTVPVTLWDATGRCVRRLNTSGQALQRIDLSGLAAGSYSVLVEREEGRIRASLVVVD